MHSQGDFTNYKIPKLNSALPDDLHNVAFYVSKTDDESNSSAKSVNDDENLLSNEELEPDLSNLVENLTLQSVSVDSAVEVLSEHDFLSPPIEDLLESLCLSTESSDVLEEFDLLSIFNGYPFDVPAFSKKAIRFLRRERLKNAGNFNDSNHKKYTYRTAISEIPQAYQYLTKLNFLSEKILKTQPDLWKLITSKPKNTSEIAKREEALCYIGWAQELFSVKEPVVKSATLNYSAFEKNEEEFDHLKRYVCFKIKADKNTDFTKLEIRTNSDVELKSLDGGNTFKDLTYRVMNVSVKSLILCEYYSTGNKDLRVLGPDSFKKYEAFKDLKVAIYNLPNDFVYRYTIEAINLIRSGQMKQFTDPQIPRNTSIEQFNNSFDQIKQVLVDETNLNDCQVQTLFSIATQFHGKAPFILNGPPGTGKTRTIGQTVRCLLSMHKNNRILLAAPSNMAADMLGAEIVKLMDGKLLNFNNVFRLRSNAVEFSKRDNNLDYISKIAGSSFMLPKNLDSYRVIICTLGSTPHITKILSERVAPKSKRFKRQANFFSHIFIDEVGQATHSDIWLPICGLASEETSVIFCGDPKQLGPVDGLNLTPSSQPTDSALFHYMSMPMYKNDPRVHCMLKMSYRCHTKILHFPSKFIYKGKLLSGTKDRFEPFDNWRALPKKKFPVLFVNVPKGSEMQCKKSKSFANLEEIKALLKYVESLKQDFDVDSKDIGIISPYKYQCKQIIAEFHKSSIRNVNDLTIDSVERYQGSERKIILMSAVRTKQMGFLANIQRLNTAITRSQNLLIVIGNKKLLSSNRIWKELICYCSNNRSVVDWSGKVKYF